VKVLLAPDKFKGTLTAAEVAAYLAAGIAARRPGIEIVTVPVADGGDGTLDAFAAAGFERVAVTADDAFGVPRPTSYVRDGARAVVELAAIAGLAALGAQRAPLTATSRGLGQVIAAALDAGCSRFVVGIGGSASTDGGTGMVQALGGRVLDEHGTDVVDGGLGAGTAAHVDLAGLHPGLGEATVEVASDVDNPLTGPSGAAAVYGPQKGASPDDVAVLDAALAHWADVVAAATGHDHRDDPGAGAAGGVGFGAVAVLGATLRPGPGVVLDALRFADRLAGADLVVTGEGALDVQTLHGKAPMGVARVAHAAGVPVVAVVGRCVLDEHAVRAAGFDAVYSLLDEAADESEAMIAPGPLLRRIGARIAECRP
jgi:glycerate 2-kinase